MSIHKIGLKITLFRLFPHTQGAKKLTPQGCGQITLEVEACTNDYQKIWNANAHIYKIKIKHCTKGACRVHCPHFEIVWGMLLLLFSRKKWLKLKWKKPWKLQSSQNWNILPGESKLCMTILITDVYIESTRLRFIAIQCSLAIAINGKSMSMFQSHRHLWLKRNRYAQAIY